MRHKIVWFIVGEMVSKMYLPAVSSVVKTETDQLGYGRVNQKTLQIDSAYEKQYPS